MPEKASLEWLETAIGQALDVITQMGTPVAVHEWTVFSRITWDKGYHWSRCYTMGELALLLQEVLDESMTGCDMLDGHDSLVDVAPSVVEGLAVAILSLRRVYFTNSASACLYRLGWSEANE